MGRLITSLSKAFHNLRTRDHSRWFALGIDPEESTGDFAAQRVNRGYFRPIIEAGFTIGEKDRLYAIGSCFARNIETALLSAGVPVESAAEIYEDPRFNPDGIVGRGFINKYTTHAILNDLRWALDPDASFPEASLIDNGNGTFTDPHFSHRLSALDLDETLWRREMLTAATRTVAECNVLFLTLGLVEVWFDKHTGDYVNFMPHPDRAPVDRSRYRLEVSDFRSNFRNMEEIHRLLTQYGHPDLQIVITVSPVPLNATFTGTDVVIANTYSKSLLRAVAQEWAQAHDNVHYFPSYEIIVNSDRSLAWQRDQRHVHPAAVDHVVSLFVSTYFDHDLALEDPATRMATDERVAFETKLLSPTAAFLRSVAPAEVHLAVDIAAGTGQTTKLLHDAIGADRTVGYDTRSVFPTVRDHSWDGIDFRLHNAALHPFPDKGPDVVFSRRQKVRYLPNAENAIAAWLEQLSPGGVVVMEEGEYFSEDPALRAYLDAYAAYIGLRTDRLDALTLDELLERVDCAEIFATETARVPIDAEEAARYFRALLGAWGGAAVKRGVITLKQSAEIGEALTAGSTFGEIEWVVSQVALRYAGGSD